MADVNLTVTLLDLNVAWAVARWEEIMGTLTDDRNMNHDENGQQTTQKFATTKEHVEWFLGRQLYRVLKAGHVSLEKKSQEASKTLEELITTG